MKRVSCRLWMNSACVCIVMYELGLEIIYVWAWFESCYYAIGPPMYDWGRNLTSSYMCCPNNTQQYWFRLCYELHLLNVLNGCHIDHGSTACTFGTKAACTIDLTRSFYWCFMQPYVSVCNFTLMYHFAFRITTIMFISALDWSALVDYMKRVSCWPWTYSAYVGIDPCMCVLKCNCVIGVWCSGTCLWGHIM